METLGPSVDAVQPSSGHSEDLPLNEGSMAFSFESFVILAETILIIVTNVITVLVTLKTNALKNVNKIYLCSLTIADLAIGLLITPFSFWTSLFPDWIFGTQFCQVQAYCAAILWIASLYSVTLISADNYVAVKKPLKYEVLRGQKIRFVCWIVVSWVTACSICAPPLFGNIKAKYYKAARLCIIDWDAQKAYFMTSGVLVAVPPALVLAFTNVYICSKSYKQKKELLDSGLLDELENISNNYIVNIVIAIVYFLSWVPWSISQLYQIFQDSPDALPLSVYLEFYLMWLAVGNSCWKFFVYVTFSKMYRKGLRLLFCYKPRALSRSNNVRGNSQVML